MARALLSLLRKTPLCASQPHCYNLPFHISTRTFKTCNSLFQEDQESENFEATVDPTSFVGANPSPDSRMEDSSFDLNNGDYLEPPWTYYFTKIKPDVTACMLADESKENIWSLHKSNPDVWTVDKLAEEYKIRKQRVHAILWLKDLEREAETKNGGPLDDSIQKKFVQLYGAPKKAIGERHIKVYFDNPEGLDEESEEFRTRLLEASEKEEVFKVREFVQRMEYNKQKMAGLVIVKKEDRRRPKEGWSYVIEELGPAGKRGKGGARRFIANSKGEKRELNDFEKSFMRRERVLPRRRIVPR